MISAFQSSAFQNNAFQVASTTVQGYVAFNTPQLDGRTIVKMVAYSLMMSICTNQVVSQLLGY